MTECFFVDIAFRAFGEDDTLVFRGGRTHVFFGEESSWVSIRVTNEVVGRLSGRRGSGVLLVMGSKQEGEDVRYLYLLIDTASSSKFKYICCRS